MGYGMGGGVLMWIILLLIIGVVVYYFVKSKSINTNGINSAQEVPGPDAMKIAKTRLAKGEITAEEFEIIKKNLL